jgi:protein-L-isoaspartate(D-aspartate) O-methyltransferase
MNAPRDVNATQAATEGAVRAAMVDEIRAHGYFAGNDAVAAAFQTVSRSRFAPGASIEEAYRWDASVWTKKNDAGLPLSTISAPWMQATQLRQADLHAGQNVLEIGSGGYNAALIATVVGRTGHVTTIDIDPFVVERATEFLAVGRDYPQVEAYVADAEYGFVKNAPYDRIIVTVGAPDIPPALMSDQLVTSGVIVAPLELRGLEWSFAFTRVGDHLVSTDRQLCGFVPMQGAGAAIERHIHLDGEEVGLSFDSTEAADMIDASALRAAFGSGRVELGSGVMVGGVAPDSTRFDDLDLWLISKAELFGLLRGQPAAIVDGRVAKSARMGAKTIVGRDSFAYRYSKPVSGEPTQFEFAVVGHGPQGERLASEYVDLIREWDQKYRRGPGPEIQVYPATTPRQWEHDRTIRKRHTNIVISWPRTTSGD